MENFDEQLVAEMHKYRHLYDSSMKEHRDSQMAKKSWKFQGI